ncbi:MAG TPA: serine/threonine protein kinase, partial [Myxococcales bacterium]|nr:serine/threonine protein kinase [Myxococcales bacterium]
MDTIQLDDLRLVRKIATGGMAEVWEARQVGVKGFEKRLAVKVILPHLNENDDFIHMFLDEGRLAAQLNHSNICQVYKLGATDDFYYMAMEFIDGVGLSSILREASRRGVFIPFQHCCQVLIGACAGLDYAHSCKDPNGNPLNLVHRDISPQNIMITYNGTVKVVDFGIAKAATQVHHTQVGVLKGKYAYMSPEQAAGHTLDGRSDVFALGIVLWEMTTGHRLFRAENEIATLH